MPLAVTTDAIAWVIPIMLQIYPHHRTVECRSLYLRESLASTTQSPFIYANLLHSLDGRIALRDSASASGFSTPSEVRSKQDWNLFCELQAHAQVLVTHGGYLRSLEKRDLGNVLSVPTGDEFTYLHEYRSLAGMSVQPAVVILSKTLEFNEQLLPAADIHVLTSKAAPARRRQSLQDSGFKVETTDSKSQVSASDLYRYLKQQGFVNTYLQTGPEFIADLLQHNLLSRLYLTTDFSIVSGHQFKTICDSPALPVARRAVLRSMYLQQGDQVGQTLGKQQLFAAYDFPGSD